MTRTLQLYGRSYCHLCDEMADELRGLCAQLRLSLEWVDIEDDERLEELYGEHIPVLMLGEREICRHRLDENALRRVCGELFAESVASGY